MLKAVDEHFERCYEYLSQRVDGGFNLWTDCPIMKERRDKFKENFSNKEYARMIYKKEWDEISRNGVKEKIINYYEDY